MATWADLLADIRLDLQDTSENPKYSDKTLYLYAKDAIRDYSTWFPKRNDHLELAPVNGTYPLPVDFIEDIHVECPSDTFLEKRYEQPGVTYRKTNRPSYFYVHGGNLYLSSPTNDTVYLTYLGTHPVPVSEGDSSYVLTIPEADLELIRLYVKSKTLGQLRGRQAALDRFKVTGKRDDNPLMPETDDLMVTYRAAVAQRVRGGIILLHRIGRGA